MAKRKVIRIDEALCDGCGNCITSCAEGALKLVDGKARLVADRFCDGFGDCIGECPTGALKIEERDTVAFDFEATRQHVAATGGIEALRQFEAAHRRHEGHGLPLSGPTHSHGPGGCPGSKMRVVPNDRDARPATVGGPAQAIPSELRQWPVQIHLVQPGAPFFRDRELVVMNTCGPIASADVHWRFLRGRGVVVGCPKLDDTRPYVSKLAAILRDPTIPKVQVVRMEVPCCGGLTQIVRQAAGASGRDDLAVEEVTLSLNGDVGESTAVPRDGITAPHPRRDAPARRPL